MLQLLFIGQFILLCISTFFYLFWTVRGLIFILSISLVGLLAVYLWYFSFFVFENGILTFEFELLLASEKYFPLTFLFHSDLISCFFTILVLIIGLATTLYSSHYFKHEGQEDVFLLYIHWFIYGMLILVNAGNFCTLLLGWEWIGITSFLLINFWNARSGTIKAALKAFTFNIISDGGLLLASSLLWLYTQESNLFILSRQAALGNYLNSSIFFYSMLGLLLSASIKSAQIVGHLWLPDSMEAPVPASALIHSATLVSAGVYLLLRFHWLIELTDFFSIISLIGAITAAYGGISASAQTDVKKLLAYSTISHCGFLFVCVGMESLLLTLVYLFLHGFFKALTFFCVGSCIQAVKTQDFRQMGLLSRLLPFETVVLVIGGINLGGMPFTMGAFFKEIFFLNLCTQNFSSFTVGCCYIGLLSSIVYIYRFIYYILFADNHWKFFSEIFSLQSSNFNAFFFRQTTLAFSSSSLILLIASVCAYLFFYNWLIYWPFHIDGGGILIENFPGYWLWLKRFYKDYFIYYHNLVLIVFLFIHLFERRMTITYFFKLNLYTFLFVFWISSSIVTFIYFNSAQWNLFYISMSFFIEWINFYLLSNFLL